MKSIKTVYKIGHGPSSSHTVGPYNAAKYIKKKYPDADGFRVTLFGSLAHTGEGHSTKKSILSAIPEAQVISNKTNSDLIHPNTMVFEVFSNNELIDKKTILSIGGGSLKIVGEDSDDEKDVYPYINFTEMLEECRRENISLVDFIYRHEDDDIKDYLEEVWSAMETEVRNGLSAEGILPGGLGISRKAKMLYSKRCYNENTDVAFDRTISSYAYACSEENACENLVVTAPTCGSCGVIPAVFYYMLYDRGFSRDEILDALAVAGLIGNVIRTNASISGAECGCQAEIGSACSMAAGGLASLYKMNISQIEYAAEIAMEHNLGLTCDPVCGLVQIPCIERNAVAAMRAITSVNLSRFLFETRKISFDDVIATMYRTGLDLNEKYRETSHGGLAEIYNKK